MQEWLKKSSVGPDFLPGNFILNTAINVLIAVKGEGNNGQENIT